ncbi:hypothetical protein Pcinc_006585 [Petrolisthes cinctipes]|uniref:Endonuclease/exonuclease/phosphatase domain-containing protein n=1 Tax=Petrolisthes cinctipes TaxID=88211 RepID=A0AAE1GCL9_PETCI|nr:hypothetical protein Pcinc_006585 [Petrolisthes cinctipes]
MDEVQREVQQEERCVVGGDLNGHIGQDNGGVRRMHGVEVWERTAEEVLGKSPRKTPRNGKESWWWAPNCKEKLDRNKEMKKVYVKERTEEPKDMLKEVN